MRVLIVGCGFVGLPLGVELVRLGHEVSGLRRSALAENELKAAGIRPLFGDVTQLGRWPGCRASLIGSLIALPPVAAWTITGRFISRARAT